MSAEAGPAALVRIVLASVGRATFDVDTLHNVRTLPAQPQQAAAARSDGGP